MRILVTGGAGYIGSHTCKALAHQGHTVVTYDNLSTGHRELVRWGDFVYGDILDTQRLRSCIRQHRIEGIIHFAASAYVGESVIDPGKYFRNNVCGTLSILDAMRDEGVPYIVVSGTCAVYGTPERMPITEDTPTNPSTLTGPANSSWRGCWPTLSKLTGFAGCRYGISTQRAATRPARQVNGTIPKHISFPVPSWPQSGGFRDWRSLATIIRRLTEPAYGTTCMSWTWPTRMSWG